MLIIDAMYESYRCYYAYSRIVGAKNALFFGFIRTMFSLQDFMGEKPVIVWEGKSKRKEENENYKANRKTMDAHFYEQLDDVRAFCSHYFDQVKAIGFEADDVMATLAHANKKAVIVTSDMDLWQCITDKIIIYNDRQKMYVTKKEVVERFNLEPEQLLIYKAIKGDGSDNIKGVKCKIEMSAYKGKHFPSDKHIKDECKRLKTPELIPNMSILRLRKVPDASIEKVKKHGIPIKLIEKYKCNSFRRYVNA